MLKRKNTILIKRKACSVISEAENWNEDSILALRKVNVSYTSLEFTE